MQGKVVLITGASSGFGVGAAVHFASKGCRLSLTGRNEANLQNTVLECLKAGAKEQDLHAIKGDLLKESDIKLILDETIKMFGKLDVLVNNAGLAFKGSVQNANMEEYDQVMNVNLRAAIFLTQLSIPYLIQTKGNVVNVSSCLSTMPGNNFMAYCVSKAGLDHFTRMAAKELGPKEVRVNSVNPGYVQTNLQLRAGISFENLHVERIHALGRPGKVEEVSKAIAFLADNDMASFITGELLAIDGGATVNY